MYIFLIVLVLAAAALYYWRPGYIKVHGKCRKKFTVLDKADSSAAADLLCELDRRINVIRKNGIDIPEGKLVIQEDGRETYTLDKGDISLCIRSPLTGRFFDINTLMFVLIHELTHVIDKEYNEGTHSMNFWKLNERLLKKAETLGVYHNVDYSKRPVPYCNIMINSNPVFLLS